jgi:NADH-quinone oxidoreductase subunit J
MDSLHAIGFYVSATLSVGGALLVALLPERAQRGLAMAGVGLGLAGLYASLSAGFVGIVVLVCYAGIALLVGAPQYAAMASGVGDLWRQVGAVGAAALLAALAYAAYRGDFMHASFYGGALGAASVGRVLFTHDAATTEAVGGLVLVALVGATDAWRRRERAR